MPETYCPSCDATISIENPENGAMVVCRECHQELEIISTRPFEVDFPLDYDEDYDEDWDEDSDDEGQ
jgi:lysine biosynthesis protein LysW